jgi:periplasmic protein CpxP/Spy
MRKLFTILTSVACLLAFVILAPVAPAQNPEAEKKVIALAQQLKLTPQQDVEVLPILKAEAPKFDAIKNDPSLSGMQKMKQLHAIQSENAPELQKILSPAQYQQLQAIREQDIKKAIAAKRAGH